MRRYQAFLLSLLAIDVVGLVLGGLFVPPDPLAQVLFLGPLLVAAPAMAYWLVYRGGFARLGVGGSDRFD